MLRGVVVFLSALILVAAESACTHRTRRVGLGLGSGMLAITGEVSYPPEVAREPGSVALIEIHVDSVDEGPSAPVAVQRIDLTGRKAPVSFGLLVARAGVSTRGRYSVRAMVFGPDGKLASTTTEAHVVDPGSPTVNMGTLLVTPAQSSSGGAGGESTYVCGNQVVTARFEGDSARISLDIGEFHLRRTDAASGARFASESDPTTFFWTRAGRAMLEIEGRRYAECDRIADILSFPAPAPTGEPTPTAEAPS